MKDDRGMLKWKISEEEVEAYLRYYIVTPFDRPKNITKNLSQERRCTSQASNQALP
jgi:hypothetical protein